MFKRPKTWWDRIANFWDRLCALRQRGALWAFSYLGSTAELPR